jgi:NodT family efflux transporter outer membrane factor (OMF) lipoprotein
MLARRGGLLAAAFAAGLCGCTVGPDYQVPDVLVPVHFGSARKEIVPQELLPPSESMRWWQTLHDKQLNRLVEKAIECNPDIEIALTRVQAMRMQQAVIIGSALPKVDLNGGGAAGTGTDMTKGRAAQSLRSAMNNTGFSALTSVGGFDAGWELDLFGRYRRLLEAAQADAEALAELKNAVLVSVVADVVRSYIEIRALRLRLEIARDAVKTAQNTVNFMQSRYDRGLTNELDLTLAKRQLATIQARLPELASAISHAESRLAPLLGGYTADVLGEMRISAGLPHVPTRLRAGVPAELLRRRPDIREAERSIAAATASIGVATANLFPTVFFTAGFGAQGGDPTGKTPHISNPIWSAGPGGYWPFLDFGRLDALIYIQDFRAQAAIINYKRAIVTAVAEVDDAIKQYRAQQQRQRDLANALAQSRRAVDLATERYERGLTDFLNVLDAQRQEYEIEDQSAIAQEAVVIQYIALYKALGGGWELYDALPAVPQPQPAVVATVRRLTNGWQ